MKSLYCMYCDFVVQLDDLDKLSLIHVSGTKGKGSTCAFTESILRQYNLKTGFFRQVHVQFSIHCNLRKKYNKK